MQHLRRSISSDGASIDATRVYLDHVRDRLDELNEIDAPPAAARSLWTCDERSVVRV